MKNKIAVFAALVFLATGAASLRADTTAQTNHPTHHTKAQRDRWHKNHPVRTRDRNRINHQKQEARQEFRDGKITKSQERADIKDDNAIGQQMRADAQSNHNGGHLNGQQAGDINKELNAQQANLAGPNQSGSVGTPVTPGQ